MIPLPLLLVVLEELRRGREPELLHARELRRRRFLRVHAGRLRLEFVVHGVDDVQTAHGLRRRSAFFAFARASPRGVLTAVHARLVHLRGEARALSQQCRLLASFLRRLQLRRFFHVVLDAVEGDEEIRDELKDATRVVRLERLAEKFSRRLHAFLGVLRQSLSRRHVIVRRLRERHHDVPESIVHLRGGGGGVLIGIGSGGTKHLVVHRLESVDHRRQRLLRAVQVQRRRSLHRLKLRGQKLHARCGLLQLLRDKVQQRRLAIHRLDIRQTQQCLETESARLPAIGPAVEVVSDGEDALQDGDKVLARPEIVRGAAHELVLLRHLSEIAHCRALEDERVDALRQARDGHHLQEVLLHCRELRAVPLVIPEQRHLLRGGHREREDVELVHPECGVIHLQQRLLDLSERHADARELNGDVERSLGVDETHHLGLVGILRLFRALRGVLQREKMV